MKPCDHYNIDQFLSGDCDSVQQREFEQHLDSCETCCQRLEQSTAEHTWWREAERYLPDAADDMQPLLWQEALQTDVVSPVSSSTELPDLDQRQAAAEATESLQAAVQTVVHWLGPTDDPQMLGRVGNYEVAGVIGAGGMSVVLKALDRPLNRFVAIKVLAPHLATSAAARQRFAREAQAAAAVVHENVIAIHGVDQANGLPYLVMPYEKGNSLQNRLQQQGPLATKEILRIGCQVAAGLAAAHAQGLIHRDVKPANILLADGVERVKITDFGLARAADDASLTRTGTVAGTPQYMSPEQARGDAVDQRSDLFSLGSVLYVMCTGRLPFRAENSYGVLTRIAESQPRAIQQLNSDIPWWLCQLIARLHAKRPGDRYDSAEQVAADLEHCLAHVQQPDVVDLPGWLAKAKPTAWSRWSSSRRLSTLTRQPSIVLVLLCLLVLGGLTWSWGSNMLWPQGNRPTTPGTSNTSTIDSDATASSAKLETAARTPAAQQEQASDIEVSDAPRLASPADANAARATSGTPEASPAEAESPLDWGEDCERELTDIEAELWRLEQDIERDPAQDAAGD